MRPDLGLYILAAFVFGLTAGFRWSDRLWRQHIDKIEGRTDA